MAEPANEGETWPHIDRRQNDDYKISILRLLDRMDAIEQKQESFHSSCADSVKAVADIKADTQEIIQAFQDLSSAMRVLEVIGRIAKPISYLLMLVAPMWGIWTMFKTGAK